MVLTETDRLHNILKWEQVNLYSREKVTVLSGENLSLGAVVGKIERSAPTDGTEGTNEGNGTCTGVTAGQNVQIGTYILECVAEAENGGTFKVTAPDGSALPDAAVGVAYSNPQINFTINDDTSDFEIGDTFTIEVTAGSGKVVEIDFSAVDGSRKAYGFVISDYDASEGDVEGVAIVRDATIIADNLVWPSGATTPQKAAALAQLKAVGIVEREEA